MSRRGDQIITQIFKIPHLRNIYTKIGMFGFPDVSAAAGEIDDQLAAGRAINAASLDRLRASMDAVGASRHDDAPGEAAVDQT